MKDGRKSFCLNEIEINAAETRRGLTWRGDQWDVSLLSINESVNICNGEKIANVYW